MATAAALFVVYSDAVPGREAEFNDWYTHVHIRDVMRIPGALAVQRFELGESNSAAPPSFLPNGARYLAIYELADTRRTIDVHLDDCFTDRMPISDALDVGKSQDTFYEPLDPASSAVAVDQPHGASDLVLIGFDALPGRDEAFLAWYRDIWYRELSAVPGLSVGQLYAKGRTQLMPTSARRFVATYRLSNGDRAGFSLPATLRRLAAQRSIDAAGCEFAHYRALMPRLTAHDVLAAGPDQRAIESRARAALGDRLHRFSLREIRKTLATPFDDALG